MGFWTNREDERLIALAREGVTELHIGERLGRSKTAVQARKAQLRRDGRLERRPEPPRRRAAATPGETVP